MENRKDHPIAGSASLDDRTRAEQENLHITNKHTRIVTRLLFLFILPNVFLRIPLEHAAAFFITEEKYLSPETRLSTGGCFFINFFFTHGINNHKDTSVTYRDQTYIGI